MSDWGTTKEAIRRQLDRPGAGDTDLIQYHMVRALQRLRYRPFWFNTGQFQFNATANQATYNQDEDNRRGSDKNVLNSPADFDDTAEWDYTNVDTTPPFQTAAVQDPNGGYTAWEVTENDSAAGSQHFLQQDVSKAAAPAKFAARVWIRDESERDVRIIVLEPSSANVCRTDVIFDADGVPALSGTTEIGDYASAAATSTAVDNSWYRIDLTGVSNDAANIGLRVQLTDAGDTTYDGDGSSGVYLWKALMLLGSAADLAAPPSDVLRIVRLEGRDPSDDTYRFEIEPGDLDWVRVNSAGDFSGEPRRFAWSINDLTDPEETQWQLILAPAPDKAYTIFADYVRDLGTPIVDFDGTDWNFYHPQNTATALTDSYTNAWFTHGASLLEVATRRSIAETWLRDSDLAAQMAVLEFEKMEELKTASQRRTRPPDRRGAGYF